MTDDNALDPKDANITNFYEDRSHRHENPGQTIARLSHENAVLRTEVAMMEPGAITRRNAEIAEREQMSQDRLQESQNLLETSIVLNKRAKWLSFAAALIFALWAVNGLWNIYQLWTQP